MMLYLHLGNEILNDATEYIYTKLMDPATKVNTIQPLNKFHMVFWFYVDSSLSLQ